MQCGHNHVCTCQIGHDEWYTKIINGTVQWNLSKMVTV